MIAWHLFGKPGLWMVWSVLFLEGNLLCRLRSLEDSISSPSRWEYCYQQPSGAMVIPPWPTLFDRQCCWSPAGGQTEVLSILFVALPPPTLLLIGWINLEGNLTRSRIPPKLTIGIVFYICPQERQMLSLSTTSTFEYPYLDTMRENTKADIFWRSRQMHNFGDQDGLP